MSDRIVTVCVDGIDVAVERYPNGTSAVAVTFGEITVVINHQVLNPDELEQRIDPRPYIWIDAEHDDVDPQVRMGDAEPTGWA